MCISIKWYLYIDRNEYSAIVLLRANSMEIYYCERNERMEQESNEENNNIKKKKRNKRTHLINPILTLTPLRLFELKRTHAFHLFAVRQYRTVSALATQPT